MTIGPKANPSFTRLFLASPAPLLVLAPDAPRFTIREANDAYLAATMRTRVGLVGRGIFEAFPDNPNDATIAGVSQLRASLERVLATLLPNKLPDLKYDVARPDGTFEERWWSPVNSPVLSKNGEVEAIIHNAVDVTEQRRAETASRENEARQAFLLQLNDALRAEPSANAIADRALRMLSSQLQLDRCYVVVYRLAEDIGDLHHQVHDDSVLPLPAQVRLSDFPKSLQILLDRTLVVDNVVAIEGLSDKDKAGILGLGLHAFINATLRKGEGHPLWAVVAASTSTRVWTRGEVSLVEEVAERTWAAVERARAEAALREGEALLSAVLDALPVGVILADAQGSVIRDNAANRTLWGVLPETTGFEHYGEWVGWWPETSERIEGTDWAMARALLHGETVENELIENQRFGTGERRFILNNAAPVRDASGTIVAAVVAQMDVTERLAAERALKLLNETLEQRVEERTAERDRLWRNSQDMLVVAETDGTFVAVNKAWSDILGREEHELVGSTFVNLTHPNDLAATVAVFKKIVETPLTEPHVYRLRHRNGEYRWISWTAAYENGHIVANGRDITDERARAAELADRTAERDQVWNLSRGLLLIADLEGVFQAANPAWTRTLGYTEAETIGRSYRDFIVKEDMYSTEEKLLTAALGTDVDGFENCYRHKDGSIRRLTWHTSTAGGLIYAFARDVTDERIRDEEREALEGQLRQAQKMEAMGSLTGGVAHDFNNLLTPILGSLDMLQRKGLGNEREQRLIAGAVQSADRAKTLVQRLLAFARRQPLQTTSVDLGPLVRGMADLVASTTGPHIKVVIEASEGLPPAKADSNQLEMAILNLAVNARDAMPEGGTLRISIDAETVESQHRANLPPGRYLQLSIADTGTGMDEETLRRAAEPFFSTKGVGKGTGLGLSMVHGLASQLGGAVTILSTPGIGTNVELWLPQSAEPLVETRPANHVAKTSTSGGGTALLVDDEDFVRLSTANMLIDLGYTVVEAGSAEEALNLVDRGLQPDVLITDHLMPGMSGTVLARILQNSRPGMKVLVVSGYAEAEDVAPDLPRLTKPFRSVDLAESLAALS